MGFIYSSLNRGAGESVALFDNRIARMLPFVTGKAYFDLRNYDAQTGEFGVYIEWDGELEADLDIHCRREDISSKQPHCRRTDSTGSTVDCRYI